MKTLSHITKSFLIVLYLFIAIRSEAQNDAPVMKSKANHKSIVKFGFFSPLCNNLNFSYEQVFNPMISMEGTIGFAGAGIIANDQRAKGVFLKAGPKFFFHPDYLADNAHRYNDMQGFYFKPMVAFSYFGTTEKEYSYRQQNVSGALIVGFGLQKILANTVCIDIYNGAGYGFSSYSTEGNHQAQENYNKYSNIQGPNDVPVAWVTEIKVGVMIR